MTSDALSAPGSAAAACALRRGRSEERKKRGLCSATSRRRTWLSTSSHTAPDGDGLCSSYQRIAASNTAISVCSSKSATRPVTSAKKWACDKCEKWACGKRAKKWACDKCEKWARDKCAKTRACDTCAKSGRVTNAQKHGRETCLNAELVACEYFCEPWRGEARKVLACGDGLELFDQECLGALREPLAPVDLRQLQQIDARVTRHVLDEEVLTDELEGVDLVLLGEHEEGCGVLNRDQALLLQVKVLEKYIELVNVFSDQPDLLLCAPGLRGVEHGAEDGRLEREDASMRTAHRAIVEDEIHVVEERISTQVANAISG